MFTAPTADEYFVSGDFLGIDVVGNSHPVSVVLDNSPIVTGRISAYGQDIPFNFAENLSAGDTLAFEVGTGSEDCTFCFLSTGLRATISTAPSSPVPEPGTVGLVGSGLAWLMVMRRRKRAARIRRGV